MDVIRVCEAEMQQFLMGSLDSRLDPTDCVGFDYFLSVGAPNLEMLSKQQ